MLNQFRADNFKSLVNVAFEPSGLNLLVGSNNAGKTNLCHAMRFLSLTSKMSLQEAASRCTAEPWSLANVYLDKPSIDLSVRCTLEREGDSMEFEYELSLSAPRIDKAGRGTARLEVISEKLRLSGGQFKNTVLLENQAGKVELLHERAFLGPWQGQPPKPATTAPTDHTMLFRLYDLEDNQRANLFKRYLGDWQYFNFDALCLRDSTARPMDRELLPNGSNLASVLYTMKGSDERTYRKILEAAKAVEPKLDLINFQSPDPEHVYLFFEDDQGKRFGAQNLSDGTLRYLALCTVIISNRAASGGAPPIILVEEPENGIFVGHLKPLFERLNPTGVEGQYVFTSHAPYFIDLFDSCLDGIWVVRSQKTHSLLERPGRSKLEANLGQYSLGEMHFRGLLQ